MAFLNIVIKPYLVTLFHEDCPLCSLALRLRNTKVPVWTHESIGYPKMDISHWDAAIHYGVQLAQYCDQTLSCANAISRRLPPVYSLALRLRNTKVPVWTHESIGYPKMDISHWDAAIHYGVQLLWSNPILLRISRRLPLLCSLALRLRNTKVPVWTHESIGYPQMDISHWDAAIHYGFSLPNIVIKPYLVTLFHGDRPLCTPLSLRLRNTKVPVWTHGQVHRVPVPMDISHWDAAIHYGVQLPNIVIQPDLLTLFHGDPPWVSLALRLRNTKGATCVDYASIGYPKMDISHWDAAIHYGVAASQYCDQTLSCYAISRDTPWTPLP